MFWGKPKKRCLVCNRKIKGEDYAEVKYRYGLDKGEIGTAYVCIPCADKLDRQAEEQNDVEPI